VENVSTPTKRSPSEHSHSFNLRLAAGVIFLLPAIWFSWKTIDGLAGRRFIRTDLAEIQHARYGILSADQWRGIIGPMFNAQIDKLNLKGQSKSLRPMVERSLYALLDNIKAQMTSPNAKASGMPGGGNPIIVNMIIGALRPHVPEYTNVVMAELDKPQTQKSFQDSIRGVLADAVKDTFGNTDMTTYNAILKHYGCSSGAVCEVTLANQIEAADKKLTRYYLTVLASAALGFILLTAGKRTLSRSAVVVLMLFCLAMLVGGVLSPMLEVEVRVTKIDATLLGTPIEFRDQSLYYRSKTGCRSAHPFQRGLPGVENAGARRGSLPAGALAHQPLRQASGFRSIQVVHGRRDGPCNLYVLRRVQRRRLELVGRLARHAEHPPDSDPDECVQNPARLLLVCWFLRVEHLPVEEAGARDRFQFYFRIKLDSLRKSLLRWFG